MAKSMILWHANPSAPWPMDPAQGDKMNELIFGGIDNALKAGAFLEFGFFPEGASGYAIFSGDPKDAFKQSMLLWPFIEMEVHEIVPYETGKEIALKVQAEAMKR